jgi:DNA-binding protein H-NS
MIGQLRTLDVPALLKLRDAVQDRIAYMREKLTGELASLNKLQPPSKRPSKTPKRPAHALKGTKRPAKFRDPQTGVTWAGVGLAPRWLTSYEKSGRSREQFAIGANGQAMNVPKRRARKAA